MRDYYPYLSVLPWILSPNTSAMILLRNYWLVYNLYDCQTAHFRPIGLHCSVSESQHSDSNVIITDGWQWWFNNSSQSAQISLQLTCWTLNWEYRTCYHSYHLSILISQACSEGKTTQDSIHGTIVCSACKAPSSPTGSHAYCIWQYRLPALLVWMVFNNEARFSAQISVSSSE